MKVTAALTASAAFHDQTFPSTERLNLGQESRVADYNARIDRGELALEDVSCLCGGQSFSLIATFDRYRIKQQTVMCDSCGLIQSMPRLTHDAYGAFYASDDYRALYDPELLEIDDAVFEAKVLAIEHRFDYVAAHLELPGPGKVVEIGCAGGWNLVPFRRAGWTVTGFDPGPALVEFGRSKGLDLAEGTLDDAIAVTRAEPVDLIILSHVVEHFLDPVIALSRLLPCLTERGGLYIEVPDSDGFCLGMLQNAHTYYFTRRTLSHYAGRAGFAANGIDDQRGHMGGLFRPAPQGRAPEGLDEEAARMRRIIRRHERREAVKAALDRSGLGELARRVARMAR